MLTQRDIEDSLNTYYYHTDAHGDVTAITGEDGSIVATFSYDPWGVPTEYNANGEIVEIGFWAGTPSDGLFLLFGGMLYDALAGIYLTRTRAYDPKRGRFLERDILDEDKKDGYKGFPFGQDAIGTNLYGWCKNNPVNRIDPSGEWSFSGIGRFVGRAVGRIFGRPSLGARIGGTIGGIVDYALGYSGISLGGGYSGGGYGWAGHARRAAEIRQHSAPAPAPKPAPKVTTKVADISVTFKPNHDNSSNTLKQIPFYETFSPIWTGERAPRSNPTTNAICDASATIIKEMAFACEWNDISDYDNGYIDGSELTRQSIWNAGSFFIPLPQIGIVSVAKELGIWPYNE